MLLTLRGNQKYHSNSSAGYQKWIDICRNKLVTYTEKNPKKKVRNNGKTLNEKSGTMSLFSFSFQSKKR